MVAQLFIATAARGRDESHVTIHPDDMGQQITIWLFLDALPVSHKATDKNVDDTGYLSASPAMKAKERWQNKFGKLAKLFFFCSRHTCKGTSEALSANSELFKDFYNAEQMEKNKLSC